MRLNWYWRGIDLVDVELHAGSKGFSVDLSVFQPRAGEVGPSDEADHGTADLSGISSGSYDLAEGPVWHDDQPVVVQAQTFGFGKASK